MKVPGYYVYLLSYPTTDGFDGSAFFVGKGIGDSIHHNEKRSALKSVTPKNIVILAIHAKGCKVRKSYLHRGLSEVEALQLQSDAITTMCSIGVALTNLPITGKRGERKDKQAVLAAIDPEIVLAGYAERYKGSVGIIKQLLELPDDYEPPVLSECSLDELLEYDRETKCSSIW